MSEMRIPEIRKTIPSVAHTIRRPEEALVQREDKPKIIIQTNLTPVRCGQCNALLAKATTGSVLGIVCGRCKTYNFVEVSQN
jgi:hypothetical protein